MIFPPDAEIYVAHDPADLRWGVDRLSEIVTRAFRRGVRGGAYFVFVNKRRTKLRIVHYDKSGAWLLSKRLDMGTFAQPLPLRPGDTHATMTAEQLRQMLEGQGGRPKKQPKKPPSPPPPPSLH